VNKASHSSEVGKYKTENTISLRKDNERRATPTIENAQITQSAARKVKRQDNRQDSGHQSEDKTSQRASSIMKITKELPSVPGVLEPLNRSGIDTTVHYDSHADMLLKDPKPLNLKLEAIKLNMKVINKNGSNKYASKSDKSKYLL
jgi:hypothetical protein